MYASERMIRQKAALRRFRRREYFLRKAEKFAVKAFEFLTIAALLIILMILPGLAPV